MARVSLGSLVVGVVFGIALGFAAAVTFLTATDTSDPGGDDAHSGADATATEGGEPSSANAHRPGDRARRAAADPYGELAAGLPPVEVARGTGTFDGVVRDGKGGPVAGIRIRAEPILPKASFDESDPPDSESAEEAFRRDLRGMISRHRLVMARLRETTTGPDGRYRIEGVPDGRYDLYASGSDWRIEPVAGLRTDRDGLSPGVTRDWIARRRLGFVADVTGVPDGEDVTIQISPVGEAVNWWDRAWPAGTRRIEIDAGEHRVRAVAGEDGEWKSPWSDVTVSEDAPAPEVALPLREVPGFTGTIVAAPGNSEVSVRIGVAKFRDGAAPPRSELLVGKRFEWVQPGRRFAFLDTGAGRWAVLVSAPGRRVLAEDVVDVGEGLTRRDFQLPPGDLGATIRARVLGPDGKPAPDVRFLTGFEATDGSSAEGDVDPVPGEGGTWLVPHWERGSESNSSSESGGREGAPDDGTAAAVKRRWIEVSSPTCGTERADYAPGDAEVVVQFRPAATLVIELEGADVAARRRVTVDVNLTGADSRNWRHDAPARWDDFGGHARDPDAQPPEAPGPVRLGPIPAGEVEIRAGIATGWGDSLGFHQVRQTLVAGANRIRIAVPTLQDLRVTSEGDDERISLRAEGGPEVQPTEEPGTSVVFRFLPPGRYTLSNWDRGEMTVVVPGPSEVRFAPKPYDAFRVAQVEEGGSAMRAGLREGDLVVAVNGRELSGRNQMQAALSAAQLEEKVKLTVLRSGARLEIEVPAAAMESMSLEETTR